MLLFAEGFLEESGKKLALGLVGSIVMSTLAFLVGRYWGRYKANRSWQSKVFLDRIIVSLNIFAEGTLKIRTVLERGIDEVFLNKIAIAKVMAAAKQCTPTQPLLPIAKGDRWYLLNFILNAVAEQFAEGHLKQDAGLPVTTIQYGLFLTCEVVGEERIRKVRAMLVRREHLMEFPYPDEMPKLENPWHSDRIKTLRIAAELYAREPDQFIFFEACI
jgi:hypothetical protein